MYSKVVFVLSISFLATIILFPTSCTTFSNKNNDNMTQSEVPEITGIGGIFFKTNDPKQTREWYSKILGFKTNEYGSLLETLGQDTKLSYLQWSPFQEKTNYF